MKEFDLLQSSLEGTHLIEACAGTGKTYSIAFLVLRLLMERELKIGEILVLTYTNNATDELRDRIRNFIQKAINALSGREIPDETFLQLGKNFAGNEKALRLLKEALRDFDEAAVYTIHGFCHQVLRDYAFESGIPIEMEISEDDSIIKESLFLDFWRRHFYRLPVEVMTFIAQIEDDPFDYFRKIAIRFPREPSTKLKPQKEVVSLPSVERLLEMGRALIQQWQQEGETCDPKHREKIGEFISHLNLYLSGKQAFPIVINLSDEIKLSKLRSKASLSHEFISLLEAFEAEKNRLYEETEKYFRYLAQELCRTMKEELPRRKRMSRELSFDDLLLELYRSITDEKSRSFIKKAVRERYKAALIDEFQDTDPVQYEIIDRLFGAEGPLFLIGDPRQAIYSFRGADLFTYVTACQKLGRNNIFTLTGNYRSTPALLSAINAIFSQHPNPFVFSEIDFISATSKTEKSSLWPAEINAAPLQIWYFRSHYLASNKANKSTERFRHIVSAHLAAEVKKLVAAGERGEAKLDGKSLNPGDIVILVRNRFEAKIVQEYLTKVGVKSIFHRMGPLFETPEASSCLIILRAILEPHRSDIVKAALTTPILGKTVKEITSKESDAFFPAFYRYRTIWEREGFLPMFRALLRENNVRERLLMTEEGERKLTNVLHLGEVLHEREAKERLTPANLVKWLDKSVKGGQRAIKEYELRLESDEGAVMISTIHGAKGLEFPVVFCPFLWSSVKKSKEDVFNIFHEKSEEKWQRVVSLERAGEEEETSWLELLAEECRLLYVALTRAIYRSYVFWGKVPLNNTSPLAFLFHYRKNNVCKADMEQFMNDYPEGSIIDDLQNLSAQEPSCIHLSFIECEPEKLSYPPQKEEIVSMAVRIPPDISNRMESPVSFTYLAARRNEEGDYLDTDVPAPSGLTPENADPVFLFPSGLRAGLAIHRIMEILDYEHLDRQRAFPLIVESLRTFGLSLDWAEAIWLMVERTLKVPLDGDEGRVVLGRLSRADRLTEMSFTLPMETLTSEKLRDLFADTYFADYINQLDFQPVRGFLRGFMDLIFRFEGKYYLLDWKTNHLGYDFSDYTSERLKLVIGNNLYFLQYHLYLLALHRHLKRTLSHYDYEKHIGGVFYLFMRGINPNCGSGNGIYRDLPPAARIEKMDRLISSG